MTMYTAELTLRRDGHSSLVGATDGEISTQRLAGWDFLWTFLQDVTWLDNLRVRAFLTVWLVLYIANFGIRSLIGFQVVIKVKAVLDFNQLGFNDLLIGESETYNIGW